MDTIRMPRRSRLTGWGLAALGMFALAGLSFVIGAAMWVSGNDIGVLGLMGALFWFTVAIGFDVVARRRSG